MIAKLHPPIPPTAGEIADHLQLSRRALQSRKRVWQPACVAAGVGRIEANKRKDGIYGRRYSGAVPYDLRHSFASLLIDEGELSIVEVAKQLGHSTETLLRVYAHVIAEMPDQPKISAEAAIAQARERVHGAPEGLDGAA